jgi:hypothetical protein
MAKDTVGLSWIFHVLEASGTPTGTPDEELSDDSAGTP